MSANGQYIIGITGHRRLPPGRVPALTAEIAAFYDDEIARHGAENITVLSSLAAGVDPSPLYSRIQLPSS